jgi:hypothetical protein
VRTLALRGLDESACYAVLEDRELSGAEADWATLAQMYSGNPLALKLVSEPIREIFGGDIAAFLQEGDAFFNGVGRLLDAQYARSTSLEQALLLWLAIERDLAPLDALLADLAGTAGQREVLQALESLRRRYLIERAEGRPAFTLQPVVLEYLTAQIVETTAAELIDGRFELLCSHALLQARAREYVRQSQARLLVAPVLARLRQQCRTDDTASALLLERLAALRALPPQQQRYGGGQPGQPAGPDARRAARRRSVRPGVVAAVLRRLADAGRRPTRRAPGRRGLQRAHGPRIRRGRER